MGDLLQLIGHLFVIFTVVLDNKSLHEPGVLVVSPFAGAGEMMHEALLCNTYEIDEAAEIIHRVLTMPGDELQLRMSRLRRREMECAVNYWIRSFLKAMGSIEEDDVGTPTMQPVSVDDFDYLLNGSQFVHPLPSQYEDKVSDLLKALQESICRDGAWVENKGPLLTFHYRDTPSELRPKLWPG